MMENRLLYYYCYYTLREVYLFLYIYLLLFTPSAVAFHAFSPQQVVISLSPQVVISLSPQQVVISLSPQQVVISLSPQVVFHAFSPQVSSYLSLPRSRISRAWFEREVSARILRRILRRESVCKWLRRGFGREVAARVALDSINQ